MRKQIKSLFKLDKSGSAALYESENKYILQLLRYELSYNIPKVLLDSCFSQLDSI